MNFKNILPLIICMSVLILATAGLALSRSARHRTAQNFIGHSDPPTITEMGPAAATMAFARQVQCAFREDTSSLIPSKSVFHQPTSYATTRTPNFSAPIRRAPIRRKGRIQH
ncbi:MAG TPA: hypothetical protein VJT71_04415 [Pyrinomonadaceae bacterium]|nr:hypothetical protein [Pyrinomonadaceae bacterium]